MTRRSATLAAAGVVIVILVAVAALLPVPYVIYSPGPTEDTLGEWDGKPVVQVENEKTYPTGGQLDLTTVGVTRADADIDLLTALRAWIDSDQAVVPREIVYPPGTTAEQSRQENQQFMQRSQEDAKAAALRELDYDVPSTVVVDGLVEDAPADGKLKVGDVIVAVDGEKVSTPQDVVDAVTAHEPGEKVDFDLLRDDKETSLSVGTIAAEDDGRALVGFQPSESFDFPVDITIGIDDAIGGPSAGTIFALAIYDTLTPGEMLGDHHVAGTGEIRSDGDVQPIGGIAQKISAASSGGAELFLAPVENCSEAAKANNRDMRVVPVDDLDDAIAAVETFVDGDESDLPSCSS